MDSEDSRPGSSASSSNSSDNSRQSSPSPTNEDDEGRKSPTVVSHSVASPQSSNGRRSRPRSRSSNEAGERSNSSSSSSSSSSDDNDNDDAKSAVSGTAETTAKSPRSSSGRSSSEGGSPDKQQQRVASRNQSVSPAHSDKSHQSSRSSSSSSSHAGDDTAAAGNSSGVGINISHEDLSDVSDMESEKRASSSFNNSKQSIDDEATNASNAQAENEAEPPVDPSKQRRYSLDLDNSQDAVITDLRQKLDQKKNQIKASDKDKTATNGTNGSSTPNGNGNANEQLEVLVKAHDEDALDFEAEEGECQDISKDDDITGVEQQQNDGEKVKKSADKSDGEAEDGEELEEGEVSDEDEKRPEETEPKPVCRFYTRGQCTWGMSCRFLHPGVTDKGNYTMFDLVRPVPVPQAGGRSASYAAAHAAAEYHEYRTERPPMHHRPTLHPHVAAHHDARTLLPAESTSGPVVVESAWERGLRTAKEMMRKANKRKEQDMDFEDKKMNLTLSPDELEKEPYYIKERSPADVIPPAYAGRHGLYQEAPAFSRGPPTPYDEVDPYGRTTRYRELPPHRMPQYEDERRVRPTREVIVQRVEPPGRGDEWSDPWMRRGGSQDRAEKRRRDRRSYSSNSSYSSSSSTQSDSSSDSSRSPSPADHRRRYNSSSHRSPPVSRRHAARSPAPRRSRRSPIALTEQKIDARELKSNTFKDHELLTTGGGPPPMKRRHMSPSPVIDKRSAYSPMHKRKKSSPAMKKSSSDKIKIKRRHASSSSGSGSSDSSASDSDSDSGSSSSDSSSRSRDRTPQKRTRPTDKSVNDRKPIKKVEPPKKRSPISIELKKPTTVGTSALAASPTHSVSSEKDSKKSRREELLKQLRAVEDAIAKKRSKLA